MLTPNDALDAMWDGCLDRLKQYCSFESVSTNPSFRHHVLEAAQYSATLLQDVGCINVRVIPTTGYPIVVGSTPIDPLKPTILIYGHYDVQPADPYELWLSPPFEPTIRDGYLYARGASDDKGQLLCHIQALALYQSMGQALPVNVRFVIEGEEEIGSKALIEHIQNHQQDYPCDVCIVSDTTMTGLDKPSICVSLRGLVYTQLTVRTLTHDLHSGQHGGAVPNAIECLAVLVSQLKNQTGVIQIPHFYEHVMPISSDLKHSISLLSPDAYLHTSGAIGLHGEAGFDCHEQRWFRPTLEINGIWGGYTHAGEKTVIPATAHAKISMRLVGHQDPHEIYRHFYTYLQSLVPTYAELTCDLMSVAAPFFQDPSSRFVQAGLHALTKAFDIKASLQGDGGSIPVIPVLRDALNVPIVLMGFNQLDDCIHAPNERFRLLDYKRGILASAGFMQEVGQLSHV